MLGNAAPTPFDLRFPVFGIPVRVHPLFWALAAIITWHPDDLNTTLLGVACVFVSILIHELGHALFALHYGWPPEIVLYVFGGYATYSPGWGHTTGRKVTISFAGPGAGFILYGVIWLIEWLVIHFRLVPFDAESRYLWQFFGFMKYINLWWGLMNLLPVYPLDGGQISRELFTHWRPRDGLEMSLKLSLLVGGAVAGYYFIHHQPRTGILFAMLAVESLQHLQSMRY